MSHRQIFINGRTCAHPEYDRKMGRLSRTDSLCSSTPDEMRLMTAAHRTRNACLRPYPPAPMPPAPDCLAPVTGIATDITPFSAVISGNTVSAGGAPVTQVGVEYATLPDMAGSQIATAPVFPAYDVPLTALTPGATYFYRAYVVAGGRTCSGDIRVFSTAIAAIVTTGTAEPFSATSASITGNTFSGMPLPPSEVGVEYSVSPAMSGSLTVPAAQVTTPFSATLSGLISEQTYYFRAYVVSGGARYLGQVKQFQTTADASMSRETP